MGHSDHETVLITASYPKLVEDQLGTRMKEAVLRARLNAHGPSDPAADIGFSLNAADGLKLVQRVGNMLLYARDGAAATARAPGDPLFVAGRAVSNVVVGDLKQFAERRLLETAEVKDIVVSRSEPITIGGLQGHEIEAKANDISSGAPLVLYQVILPTDNSYFIFQGLVGAGLKDRYVPLFKQTATSFRQH